MKINEIGKYSYSLKYSIVLSELTSNYLLKNMILISVFSVSRLIGVASRQNDYIYFA